MEVLKPQKDVSKGAPKHIPITSGSQTTEEYETMGSAKVNIKTKPDIGQGQDDNANQTKVPVTQKSLKGLKNQRSVSKTVASNDKTTEKDALKSSDILDETGKAQVTPVSKSKAMMKAKKSEKKLATKDGTQMTEAAVPVPVVINKEPRGETKVSPSTAPIITPMKKSLTFTMESRKTNVSQQAQPLASKPSYTVVAVGTPVNTVKEDSTTTLYKKPKKTAPSKSSTSVSNKSERNIATTTPVIGNESNYVFEQVQRSLASARMGEARYQKIDGGKIMAGYFLAKLPKKTNIEETKQGTVDPVTANLLTANIKKNSSGNSAEVKTKAPEKTLSPSTPLPKESKKLVPDTKPTGEVQELAAKKSARLLTPKTPESVGQGVLLELEKVALSKPVPSKKNLNSITTLEEMKKMSLLLRSSIIPSPPATPMLSKVTEQVKTHQEAPVKASPPTVAARKSSKVVVQQKKVEDQTKKVTITSGPAAVKPNEGSTSTATNYFGGKSSRNLQRANTGASSEDKSDLNWKAIPSKSPSKKSITPQPPKSAGGGGKENMDSKNTMIGSRSQPFHIVLPSPSKKLEATKSKGGKQNGKGKNSIVVVVTTPSKSKNKISTGATPPKTMKNPTVAKKSSVISKPGNLNKSQSNLRPRPKLPLPLKNEIKKSQSQLEKGPSLNFWEYYEKEFSTDQNYNSPDESKNMETVTSVKKIMSKDFRQKSKITKSSIGVSTQRPTTSTSFTSVTSMEPPDNPNYFKRKSIMFSHKKPIMSTMSTMATMNVSKSKLGMSHSTEVKQKSHNSSKKWKKSFSLPVSSTFL